MLAIRPRPAALATFLRLRPHHRSFLPLPTCRIDNLVSTVSIVPVRTLPVQVESLTRGEEDPISLSEGTQSGA